MNSLSEHYKLSYEIKRTILQTTIKYFLIATHDIRLNTLWGEVVSNVTYVLNRCPTKKLEEIVSLEMWTRDKQIMSHMKVFGSACYKHVPDSKRRKLDDKSRIKLLVGYNNTSAYKPYCPVTNKVEFNKDVIVK